MDEILHITLLYDFYCDLLTDKQRLIYEMYHQSDLSLQEISDELGTSRQGVRDVVKRAEKLLDYYEEKLGLLDKHMRQKQILESAMSDINCLLGESGLTAGATVAVYAIKDKIVRILSE